MGLTFLAATLGGCAMLERDGQDLSEQAGKTTPPLDWCQCEMMLRRARWRYLLGCTRALARKTIVAWRQAQDRRAFAHLDWSGEA
jgi:hypothetical protein